MSLYSIGQVSSILAIPVKTIRYYADIGLCVPSEIDPNTGYRHYSMDDILRIELIRCLGHGAGMSLKKIGEYIEKCDDSVSLKAYLLEQEGNIDKQIEGLLKRREFVAKKICKVTRKQLAHRMEPMFAQFPERSIYVRTMEADTLEETMLKIRQQASDSNDIDDRTLYMISDGLESEDRFMRWKKCEAGLDEQNPDIGLKQRKLEGGTYAIIQYFNATQEYGKATELLLQFIQANGRTACGPVIFKMDLMDTTTTKFCEMEIEMQTLLV